MPISRLPTRTARPRPDGTSLVLATRWKATWLPLDLDRLAWTAARGFLDLLAQRLGWVLDQDVELVVVVEPEHLGRGLHAARVRLAQIEVDDDLQKRPPLRSRRGSRRAGAGPARA